MRLFLNENEKSDLEKRIADAEKTTHTQIVLATVKRSDSYNEIPWKAFAMASSVAALVILSASLLKPAWVNTGALPVSVLSIPGAAVIALVISIIFPPFARLFLSDERSEAEVRQYAESMFLRRELFATSGRNGMLVLVSVFERKVIILPDKGISGSLKKDDLEGIISQMKHPLRRGELKPALEIALAEIIRLVKPLQPGADEKNELPDEVIEDNGI
jgi:putative membrane protein